MHDIRTNLVLPLEDHSISVFHFKSFKSLCLLLLSLCYYDEIFFSEIFHKKPKLNQHYYLEKELFIIFLTLFQILLQHLKLLLQGRIFTLGCIERTPALGQEALNPPEA
jgi:hypothetical protein